MRPEQDINNAIERYSDMILRLCVLYLRTESETERIFQRIFLKYGTSNIRFTCVEQERIWLIQQTRKYCRYFGGRTRSAPTDSAVYLELYAPGMDARQYSAMKLFWQLPETQREVIYLHLYEGFSGSEIAQILRKKPDFINAFLHKVQDSHLSII